MPEPSWLCTHCHRVADVVDDGRGYPPDIARRKLQALCLEAGHGSVLHYRVGVQPFPRIIGQKSLSP